MKILAMMSNCGKDSQRIAVNPPMETVFTLAVYDSATSTQVVSWNISIPMKFMRNFDYLIHRVEKTISDNLYIIPGIDAFSVARLSVDNMGFPVDLALDRSNWCVILTENKIKNRRCSCGTKTITAPSIKTSTPSTERESYYR